ncbi:MAG: hypothetical protein NZZ41_07250, partial [Candidatus Dojkabacteria bacterium]|nr:hypothetical protein [Candidatus Dojkabacteria bacterium]
MNASVAEKVIVQESQRKNAEEIKKIYDAASMFKDAIVIAEDFSEKKNVYINEQIVHDIVRSVYVVKSIDKDRDISYKQVLKTVFEKFQNLNLDNPTYADLTALVSSVLAGIDDKLFMSYHFILSSRYQSSSQKSDVFPLVRRRNGQIVHWLDYKVKNALTAAFDSINAQYDS